MSGSWEWKPPSFLAPASSPLPVLLSSTLKASELPNAAGCGVLILHPFLRGYHPGNAMPCMQLRGDQGCAHWVSATASWVGVAVWAGRVPDQDPAGLLAKLPAPGCT